MLFLLFICVFPCLSLKGLHLGTGRVFQWDDSIADPSPVERLRLDVSKAKAEGARADVIVHIVRLRWTLPHNWNDGGDKEKRTVLVVCEAEDGMTSESLSLMDVSISADITAIHERYVFPDIPLSIICAVRAVNAQGRKSQWKYSKLILLGTKLEMNEKKKPTVNGLRKRQEGQTEETGNSLLDWGDREQLTGLRKMLAESNLIEEPFPNWEKRPMLHLNGSEVDEKATDPVSSENSYTPAEITQSSPATTAHYQPEDQTAVAEEPESTTPSEETTMTVTETLKETTENMKEMMEILHESQAKTTVAPEDIKADQILRDPDLFLRGLLVKPSELPAEESHEDVHQELPFQTAAFDNEEVLRLSPNRLTQQEKDDYDLLEARLREAVGPHRVL